MPELQARPELKVRVNALIGGLPLQATFTLTAPWTVLFGPSGSGKSTLLRLIAGLWAPADASVVFHNEDLTRLPPHRRRIAMVAQRPSLFPHMDARSNVAFALSNSHDDKRSHRGKARELAEELLERFQAGHVARQKPEELSGGEMQRVALARAIASRPRLLLLDEVFSGMNHLLRSELIAELKRWQSETGTPILSVTHDVAEALDAATETLKLEDGRITAQGPTSETLAPERTALLERLR